MSVKTAKERADEVFETARLQRSLIYDIDDEETTDVDSPVNNTRTATPSISLSSTSSRKRKRADNGEDTARILVKGMKEGLQLVTNAFLQQGKKNEERRSQAGSGNGGGDGERIINIDQIEALNSRLDKLESLTVRLLNKLDEI